MGNANLKEVVRHPSTINGRAAYWSSNPNVIAIEEIVPRFDLGSRYTVRRSNGITRLPKSGNDDSPSALAP